MAKGPRQSPRNAAEADDVYPAHPRGHYAQTGMKPWIIFLIVALITYGSLYPFSFSIPVDHGAALEKLFADWSLRSFRMDAFGNFLLFMPFGFAGVLGMVSRANPSARITLVTMLGFALALILQIAQIYIPERTPALSDVFWNLLGIGAGIAIGLSVRNTSHRLPNTQLLPAGIIGLWIIAELLPFVPSLDVQSVRSNLKGLLKPEIAYDQLLFHAAGLIMAGRALAAVAGESRTLRWLFFLASLVVLGKIFIVTLSVNISTLAGLALGFAAWWGMKSVREPLRTGLVICSLFATYAFGALMPFEFGGNSESFSWMPFAALLHGSMLVNIQGLAENLSLYAGILWGVSVMGGRLIPCSIGLASLVMIFETLQVYLAGRTADITEPLLILLLGPILRSAASAVTMRHAPEAQRRLQSKTTAPPPPKKSQAISIQDFHPMAWGLRIGIICLVMAFAFNGILRLPQLPYNVVELFLGNGAFPFLLIFALALLWIGAGARLVAHYTEHSTHPWLALPLLAFGAGIVTVLLLMASVTDESLADVAGSTNLHWFVTNKLIWGEWAKDVFMLIPIELVSFFERLVRFASLYGPLVTFLALMFLAARYFAQGLTRTRNPVLLLLFVFLWLWLCKGITFDWSSTDNLNELIAADGPAGWGGGGYLYALLAVICANAVLLSHARFTALWMVLAAGVSAASVPVGWWLLNNGLEQYVHKYELVFSGVQFLLGPDRKQIMPQEVLFVRWCAVQLSGVLVITAGARLINPLVNWLSIRQTTHAQSRRARAARETRAGT